MNLEEGTTQAGFELPEQTPAETADQDIKNFAKQRNDYLEANRTTQRATHAYIVSQHRDEIYKILEEQGYAAARAKLNYYIQMTNGAYYAESDQLRKTFMANNAEGAKVANRARTLRSRSTSWASKAGKASDAFNRSVDAARAWVEEQRTHIQWLRDCKPTEGDWSDLVASEKEAKHILENVEELPSAAQEKERTRARNLLHDKNGYNKRSAFESMVGAFEQLARTAEERVNLIDSEAEWGESSLFADVIEVAESDFGLVQVYESVQDGFLWFIDPDTDELYYFSKSNVALSPNVLTAYRRNIHVADRWKEAIHVDLVHSMSSGTIGKAGLADWARTYHGLWNNIRGWVQKSIDKGNTKPDGFPQSIIDNAI